MTKNFKPCLENQGGVIGRVARAMSSDPATLPPSPPQKKIIKPALSVLLQNPQVKVRLKKMSHYTS